MNTFEQLQTAEFTSVEKNDFTGKAPYTAEYVKSILERKEETVLGVPILNIPDKEYECRFDLYREINEKVGDEGLIVSHNGVYYTLLPLPENFDQHEKVVSYLHNIGKCSVYTNDDGKIINYEGSDYELVVKEFQHLMNNPDLLEGAIPLSDFYNHKRNRCCNTIYGFNGGIESFGNSLKSATHLGVAGQMLLEELEQIEEHTPRKYEQALEKVAVRLSDYDEKDKNHRAAYLSHEWNDVKSILEITYKTCTPTYITLLIDFSSEYSEVILRGSLNSVLRRTGDDLYSYYVFENLPPLQRKVHNKLHPYFPWIGNVVKKWVAGGFLSCDRDSSYIIPSNSDIDFYDPKNRYNEITINSRDPELDSTIEKHFRSHIAAMFGDMFFDKRKGEYLGPEMETYLEQVAYYFEQYIILENQDIYDEAQNFFDEIEQKYQVIDQTLHKSINIFNVFKNKKDIELSSEQTVFIKKIIKALCIVYEVEEHELEEKKQEKYVKKASKINQKREEEAQKRREEDLKRRSKLHKKWNAEFGEYLEEVDRENLSRWIPDTPETTTREEEKDKSRKDRRNDRKAKKNNKNTDKILKQAERKRSAESDKYYKDRSYTLPQELSDTEGTTNPNELYSLGGNNLLTK